MKSKETSTKTENKHNNRTLPVSKQRNTWKAILSQNVKECGTRK